MELVEPPEGEIISLDLAKQHLRVTLDDEDNDNYIMRCVASATQFIESYANLRLETQSIKFLSDNWPPCPYLHFPVHPITAISSVKYLDSNGDLQEMDAELYQLSGSRRPPVLYLLSPLSLWPSLSEGLDSVEIVADVGFSGLDSGVPEPLIQAVLMLTRHLYDNPGDTDIMTIKEVPKASEYLVFPYRMWPL